MGRLWSHADFLKLWAGQSISEFGSQVSVLAIPWLAAVGLHVSPIEFSLLEVFGFLPFIMLALPAGVWVDRLRRRPILIASDTARAILLMLIPILWAVGALRIWHLLALQFLIGGFTVFFDVGYQAYLPALVEREDLVDGNSKLYLDEFGCAGCRPERGRGTDRGNHRAVRDPRRRAELRRLDALHASHAPRRGASPARRRSSASQDVAAGEGGARLGGSGIANCARSLRARPTSTFASTSRSRRSSSTPHAACTCRRSSSAQSSLWGPPAPSAERCSPAGFKGRSASARRSFRPQSSFRPARSLSLSRRDRSRFLS